MSGREITDAEDTKKPDADTEGGGVVWSKFLLWTIISFYDFVIMTPAFFGGGGGEEKKKEQQEEYFDMFIRQFGTKIQNDTTIIMWKTIYLKLLFYLESVEDVVNHYLMVWK